MEQQLEEHMTVAYKIMAKDEFADSIATMLWNIHKKCKEKGFSEEQSMNIVLHFAKSQSGK